MTKRKNILLLTSTYPRWEGDDTPGFIADFAKHIAPHFLGVYVLAPHFHHAKKHETVGNVHVKRLRYFMTTRGETIFYDGGGVTKIKKTPLYALKLLGYLVSLFFNTLYFALFRHVSLINAHWIIPQGFIAILVKLITGTPVAVTVHGADILSLNGAFMRTIKRFVLRHADIVYVNSSITQKACEDIYQREYLLIPMGTNLQIFHSAKPSAKLRKLYKLTKFTVVFVGRLMDTKGVIYLLEAIAALKQEKRDVRALIIGTGPLENELKSYVKQHKLENTISFTGWVDHSELPAYYASSDIFVGPSLYEAQGLVFIEALSAGIPVITTGIGGTRDFIENGKNGYLIQPHSSSEIYEKLKALYDNPDLLKQLKNNAPASVEATFSWEACAKGYLESWRCFV